MGQCGGAGTPTRRAFVHTGGAGPSIQRHGASTNLGRYPIFGEPKQAINSARGLERQEGPEEVVEAHDGPREGE